MKAKILLGAVVFLLASVINASALTVLDFEGLPSTYYYSGGNTNIGTYYPGVNFGPDATILDRVIGGYNSTGYPPHSGNAVFFSDSTSYVDITFDSPATYVEGWFTFTSTGYMEAYDSSSNLLSSASMAANFGSNSKMFVSGSGITRVRIHDSGDHWTGDDIAYEGNVIPEPATMSLLGLGLLGLFGMGKKKKA